MAAWRFILIEIKIVRNHTLYLARLEIASIKHFDIDEQTYYYTIKLFHDDYSTSYTFIFTRFVVQCIEYKMDLNSSREMIKKNGMQMQKALKLYSSWQFQL